MVRALLAYLAKPSQWAIRAYRRGHRLWAGNHFGSALVVSAWARVLTGIDIHPAATIGRNLTIVHGNGIVIGAQGVVGDDCCLLQGVTLGQIDPRRRVPAEGRRQPVLGDRVLVGANAVLIGPITVGNDAVIGAGAVVLCDVPARHMAVGNPARILPPKAEGSGTG